MTAEDRLKGELLRGNYGIMENRERITFKVLAKRYEEYGEQNKRSFKSDVAPLARLVAAFGDLLIDQIKPFRIEQFKKKMMEEKKPNGSPLKPGTINRTLEILGKMFSIAVANGWVANHPMRGRVKKLRQDNQMERFLSEEEEQRLLAACLGCVDTDEVVDLTERWKANREATNQVFLYPILVALLSTGARRGEVLKLTWADVDLDQRRVWFRRTKTGRDRAVHITDDLKEVLQSLPTDCSSVFPNPKTGKPYRDIKIAFRAVCKAADIEGLRLHDIRHTVATRLAARLPIQDVQKVLGHSQITTTLRYAHAVEDRIKEGLESIRTSSKGVQRGVQTSSRPRVLTAVNN